MCRVLKMAHLQRLKIIYVFKQGVLTDMAGKVLVVDDEKMIVKGIKFSLVPVSYTHLVPLVLIMQVNGRSPKGFIYQINTLLYLTHLIRKIICLI